MAKTSMNLDENIAGLICYLGAWVTGIIFIALEKENKIVRFHAWQSFLTFLPLMILSWVIGWIGAPKWSWNYGWEPGIPALVWVSWILWLLTLILWIILMLKAYQGEKLKIPVVGDIAEKQA